jgi:hypothetical protein
MKAIGPEGPLHDDGTPQLDLASPEIAAPVDFRDLWQWMIDTLTHMSLAETIALSAIIAAALAFLWPRR